MFKSCVVKRQQFDFNKLLIFIDVCILLNVFRANSGFDVKANSMRGGCGTTQLNKT